MVWLLIFQPPRLFASRHIAHRCMWMSALKLTSCVTLCDIYLSPVWERRLIPVHSVKVAWRSDPTRYSGESDIGLDLWQPFWPTSDQMFQLSIPAREARVYPGLTPKSTTKLLFLCQDLQDSSSIFNLAKNAHVGDQMYAVGLYIIVSGKLRPPTSMYRKYPCIMRTHI